MQVRTGTPADILSREALPRPAADGWAVLPAEDLWARARRWADATGRKHSCFNVDGVAPL